MITRTETDQSGQPVDEGSISVDVHKKTNKLGHTLQSQLSVHEWGENKYTLAFCHKQHHRIGGKWYWKDMKLAAVLSFVLLLDAVFAAEGIGLSVCA